MSMLVLGGDGMLGHRVAGQLSESADVVVTVRRSPSAVVSNALARCRIVAGMDVRRPGEWLELLSELHPSVVINAVGVIKHRAAGSDPIESIEVNSLFPHRLAAACKQTGTRLIHISTDCVFSGARGGYRESDTPDPVDLYGRSKLLGEIDSPECVTIRTSMIGLELVHHSGLVEWFLRQQGDVRGFSRAIWSGLTTAELARVIDRLIRKHGNLHGIWHISSRPISKYELLKTLSGLIGRRGKVLVDENVVMDRSLNSEKFQAETAYQPPSHQTMLAELASEIRERKERDVA